MGQSLAIPIVIPQDWKRLDLIINKIKMRLGRDSNPTYAGLTLTGLTHSTLIGANASKALESVTIGTGLDYTRPTLSLSHLGIEALTDPGADRILFWDDNTTACGWLAVGNSIVITTTTIDTVQDIRTSASPQFVGGTFTGTVNTKGFIGNLVTKTSGYTATATDYTILCNASGGAFTITLPAAASHTGRIYHIKKIDSSANAVTVDGNASETIDDGLTAVLTVQYESITIQSDGSEWWIL